MWQCDCKQRQGLNSFKATKTSRLAQRIHADAIRELNIRLTPCVVAPFINKGAN